MYIHIHVHVHVHCTRAAWIGSECFLVENESSFIVLFVVGNACLANESWDILWGLGRREGRKEGKRMLRTEGVTKQ